ncbi:MAG: hypothetical protein HY208_00495 [Nitrospirae bacterium]|nr:hypothetical protein [Nitrospirota bacterium]
MEADDNTSSLFYQSMTLSGSPDAPAILIHTSTNRIRRPHIAIDSNRTVHLLWQERFTKGAGSRNSQGTWVHYARIAQGQHGPVVTREELLNDRPMAMHPYLAVDAQGVAYSAWEEGQDSVILARLAGNSALERRRIATHFGKDAHGYPAVAVDRRGNLHVTWTDAADPTATQIVYTTLQPQGTGARQPLSSLLESPKQSLYRSVQVVSQPKTIGVDPSTGRVVIAWLNQRERGPIGRLAAQHVSVTLRPAGLLASSIGHTRWRSAKVLRVLDSRLTAQPAFVEWAAPVAAVGKSMTLTVVRTAVGVVSPPATSASTLHRFNGTVETLRRLQLLKFSSWSGPPPAAGGYLMQAEFVRSVRPLFSTRFLPSGSLNSLQEASPWSTSGAQPLRPFSQKEVAIPV